MKRMVGFVVVSFMASALSAESAVQEEMAKRTEARTWTSPDGGIFRYRWHAPEKTRPDAKYPLVILMHGAGERGTNNVAQLRRRTA